MRMYILIGSAKLRPMVRFMNGIQPSISFMNEMTSLFVPNSETRAPFYQAEKIRARINSSFAYEDR